MMTDPLFVTLAVREVQKYLANIAKLPSVRHNEVGETNPNGVKIAKGQQDKHILGTNNYKQSIAGGKNRSILRENPQQLLDDFAGTGQKVGLNKERVDFEKIIGQYYDNTTGKYIDTPRGIIHYDNKGGAHIVPSAPK